MEKWFLGGLIVVVSATVLFVGHNIANYDGTHHPSGEAVFIPGTACVVNPVERELYVELLEWCKAQVSPQG